MKIKSAISYALALLCMANIASCGDSGSSVGNETTTAATEPETTADPLPDNLPEADFDGYEFRLFINDTAAGNYAPTEEVGEVVSDAIYRRNRTVEERFNVNIVEYLSGVPNAEHRAAIQKLILADEESCDLILYNGKQMASESVSNHFINLYDIEHLNFSMPWWSAQLVDDLTFNGCMYVCSNNLSYEEFAASKIYYFNKEKIAELGLDDPYTLVFDGKWTIGKMAEMTKDVYTDLNGNTEPDEADFFGLLTTYSHNTWAVAFDIPVWEKNGDELECVAMSNKMLDAFDIIKSYFDEAGVFRTLGARLNELKELFKNGHGLFCFGFVGDAQNAYRDCEIEFGIVPFPKYDENQENYRTFFGANSANMFAVPIFASNTARTGIILEALSAEGYKQLIPAYYEVALKSKYLRDENSIRMLDLITETRTISFSYCYDNFSAALGFGNCLTSNYSDSFVTFYESRKNIVEARLDEVEAAFGVK